MMEEWWRNGSSKLSAVSSLSFIPNFYDSLKLKNWMCELHISTFCKFGHKCIQYTYKIGCTDKTCYHRFSNFYTFSAHTYTHTKKHTHTNTHTHKQTQTLYACAHTTHTTYLIMFLSDSCNQFLRGAWHFSIDQQNLQCSKSAYESMK